MGGSSGSQTGQTSQNSVSSPYAPTQPLLQNIISQLGTYGTGVTPQQTNAVNTLETNAGGLPNYGAAAANVANQYLGGGANTGIQDAYASLNKNLSPIANANPDPMQT